MKTTIESQRDDVIIRKHILQPGEALPWHVDLCHRFTVVLKGEMLRIEYRDSDDVQTFAIHPGMTGWDKPEPKVHRGVNSGETPYEEVIIFFVDEPGIEPQPEQEPSSK